MRSTATRGAHPGRRRDDLRAANAMIDGFGGSFIEAHPLDAETAKKIPKRMIGRTLTMGEAARCSTGYRSGRDPEAAYWVPVGRGVV